MSALWNVGLCAGRHDRPQLMRKSLGGTTTDPALQRGLSVIDRGGVPPRRLRTAEDGRELVGAVVEFDTVDDLAAGRLAQLGVEEGWYLYSNQDRGTVEGRALLEALDRRMNELVGGSWRGPARGTA